MNRRVPSRRIARFCVICCAALAAIPAGAAQAQSEALRGSVGGFMSPARGTLQLAISAGDGGGAGLASATATVNGVLAGHVRLGAESCGDPPAPEPPAGACPAAVSGVPLVVDLQPFAIGRHHLQVRIADAAGNAALIFDTPLDIAGPPPVRTPTVSLQVGDTTAPAGTGARPPATSGRAAAPTCLVPQLSMALDQRPLRVTKAGLPVLRRNTPYRFRGRLTCRVGASRRSAPIGVPVRLVNRLGPGGRVVLSKTGVVTRRTGRLTLITSYPSSRTMEFRYDSADGRTTRVRIAVLVARNAPRAGPRR